MLWQHSSSQGAGLGADAHLALANHALEDGQVAGGNSLAVVGLVGTHALPAAIKLQQQALVSSVNRSSTQPSTAHHAQLQPCIRTAVLCSLPSSRSTQPAEAAAVPVAGVQVDGWTANDK